MSGQKRPSTGLGVQSPCIRAIFYSCFVLFNSRVPWKRVPHIIQQQPTRFDSKVLSSRYRSTRVEYKQGMQASPTKGFQGGDDFVRARMFAYVGACRGCVHENVCLPFLFLHHLRPGNL